MVAEDLQGLDDFDSLSSKDLKLAIGEEIQEEEIPELEEEREDEDLREDTSTEKTDSGVEALKKLLKALSNEDVAASLKGMKININITLGDN